MGLIYLFRRLVFAQVLLGLVAFCMAEQNPEMLLAAGALAALSWYVVEGPTGRPLPQWVILPGALAAVIWLFVELFFFREETSPNKLVVSVGHFTMWLQILQLYGRKTNRDYALILVLSLLQMVGASVLSVALVFGFLLAVYCVLALFTVLLFQLKSTSDQILEATQAAAPPHARVRRPQPVFGRGVRWQFRLTGAAVGVACALVATVLFLLVPRASRLVDRWGAQAAGAIGFGDQVTLGLPLPSAGSREPVLTLALSLQGANVGSAEQSHKLRGASLDTYDPLQHTWTRGPNLTALDRRLDLTHSGKVLAPLPFDGPALEARITLRGMHSPALFSLFPPSSIESPSLPAVIFNGLDQTLEAPDLIPGSVLYRLRNPLQPPRGLFEAYRQGAPFDPQPGAASAPAPMPEHYARGWDPELPRVPALALSILRQAGLDRDPDAAADPRDAQIAAALATYLRTHYSYSLSRPSAPGPGDPVVQFLFQDQSGHCELFAAGLAALARSIGLPARLITGYLAHEYNGIGDYYVVRQTDAHAWTEIYCGDEGWRAFDATPPAALAAEHQAYAGWFDSIRQLYEHFEFTWLGTIVTYDKETRSAVLEGVKTSLQSAATDRSTWLGRLVSSVRDLFADLARFDAVSYTSMAAILVFIVVGVLSLAHRLMVRRRRLVALQLTRLPARQRRDLARRLGFYLLMLDLLERHGYRRPSWQSPFGFAKELAESHPLRFGPVVILTEHFYEIRFGHRPLDPPRHKTIRAHLGELQHNLAARDRR